MKETINLKPVEMTPQVMDELEKKGLIMRLCPKHDELDAAPGETVWKLLYEPNERIRSASAYSGYGKPGSLCGLWYPSR